MPKGIDHLPSGSWRVRWVEPDGRRCSRTFDTEEEALDFQQAAKDVLRRGECVRLVMPKARFIDSHVKVTARGFYCYMLHGDDGAVLYVGRSQNILKRLGDHLHVKGRRAVVDHVSIIPCVTEAEMKRLETALIYQHQPQLNTRGRLGRPRRTERNLRNEVTNTDSDFQDAV